MDNYGWVQNTSNLSTVRDTVDLVPSDGIDHNSLMRMIYLFRQEKGDLKKKWEWDARCRIKAICATGMVELDRSIAGYRLTPLGEELKQSPHSTTFFRGKRVLSSEEKEIFKKGLLTNPPVIRVLAVLNDSRRNGNVPLSKYEVGSQLGFVGDIGFTHFEAEYVALMGKSFNDKEGDADKWARTIISWLSQVGWVITADSVEIYGRTLPRYTTTFEVDRVLQYNAKSTTKYVPQEMLCSDHHAFPKVVQENVDQEFRILPTQDVLWISDLHFSNRHHAFGILPGSDNRLQTRLHKELSELNQKEHTLSHIIISGDLTFEASKEEYASALEFVNFMRSTYNLNDNCYSICPGNHDLKFSEKPYSEDDKVTIAYDSSKEAYIDFYRQVFGADPTESLYSIRRFLTPDLVPIEVIAINSCLLQQDKDHFRGMGYVGNDQRDEIEGKLALTKGKKVFRILVSSCPAAF